MARSKSKAATSEPLPAKHDVAQRASRALFLAAVALTPLALGLLPPSFGVLATYRAFDPIDLPKMVVLLVLVGLSFASWCVSVARNGTRVYWHRALWGVGGLVAWAGVSTLFAGSPALSVWGLYASNEGLVAFVAFGVVAFLGVQVVRSTADLRAVLAAMVFAGVLTSLYASMQFFGVDPLGWVGDLGRAFSTFGNADIFGTYLVFPFGAALTLTFGATSRRGRLAALAAGALIAFALYATGTRGAWLGALAMLACLGVIAWRGWATMRTSRRVALAAGMLGALAAVAVAVVLTRPRAASGSATFAQLMAALSNGRTSIWTTALRAFVARPITGWGPDSFDRAFQFAARADWFAVTQGIEMAHNAHSFFVQTLVTLGLPGLVLLVGALGLVAVDAYRAIPADSGVSRRLQLGLWATFLGVLVALALAVTIGGVTVWLWLVVGLVVAPSAKPVSLRVPKVAAFTGMVLGIGIAVWAATWMVADVEVGHAMNLPASQEQISELTAAANLNPLVIDYRWLVADAYVSDGLAAQKAGATSAQVDGVMEVAFPFYEAADSFDKTNALLRASYSNLLVGYAARHPASGAATRAVQVASEAVALAPYNPAALAALARAYQVSGQSANAERVARLARSIAPEYSSQTLGTLGQ